MNPAKRVCPSADHAIDTHSGCLASSPTSVYVGLSSSTIDLEVFLATDFNTVGTSLLALKIENFDTTGSGCTEPIAVRGEDQGINNISSLKRVQMFALVEIPEHCDAIFTTRCSKGAVRRNRDGVDVSSVPIVVGFQFELGKLPDLLIKV